MSLGEESTIKVGVLTVSDRCSRGEAQDAAGPALVEAIGNNFPASWKVCQLSTVLSVTKVRIYLGHW